MKVVYIEGLKMPKNCGECPLYKRVEWQDGYHDWYVSVYCGNKEYFRMDTSVRQLQCPLREVEVEDVCSNRD